MPTELNTYSITIRNFKSTLTIDIQGKAMIVNHRGDLLIMNTHQTSDKCIACFASGSWIKASKVDNSEKDKKEIK